MHNNGSVVGAHYRVNDNPKEWRLDLGGLSDVIGCPDIVPWLKGTVAIRPEFKSEILSPGPPKVGEGEFAFYITPGSISEPAKSASTAAMDTRKTVFICYSHANKKWLDRVRLHLRPLEREGLLELFDDSKIKVGARWREEIKAALDKAKVAVLLISADFLASDFIAENELPPLLKKAESGGATIIPVIVSPCGFLREKRLSGYQSVNDPSKSLESVTPSESEQILTELAEAVEKALGTFGAGIFAEAANEVSTEEKNTHAGPTKVAKGDYPYGNPVPGKPHLVESPFSSGKYVDVEGFPPGTEVKDPYTDKIFLVP